MAGTDFARAMEPHLRAALAFVMKDLVLAADAESALATAIAVNIDQGSGKALKAMMAVWPTDALWPQGSAWLRQQALLDDDDDESVGLCGEPVIPLRALMLLLYTRVSHVRQRLFRNEQIRSSVATDYLSRKFPEMELNRLLAADDVHCGWGVKTRVSFETGLALLDPPACEHPACRCTLDPCRASSAFAEKPSSFNE